MTTLHLLRVFTAADGSVGNPLGVFLDGDAVPQDQRQSVAADLGYSETVFVDDQLSGRIEIYTPLHRLAFAGHPLVGSSWLLSRELEREISSLRPPVGEVRTWVESGLTWIRGRPARSTSSIRPTRWRRCEPRRRGGTTATTGPGRTRRPVSFVHATSSPRSASPRIQRPARPRSRWRAGSGGTS